MKTAFLFFAILTTAQAGFCQIQEFYLPPNQTDAAYPAQDSHFIAYNSATQNGKLFLFIGGTFSSPKTTLILRDMRQRLVLTPSASPIPTAC